MQPRRLVLLEVDQSLGQPSQSARSDNRRISAAWSASERVSTSSS
jgi:hypothetical protein